MSSPMSNVRTEDSEFRVSDLAFYELVASTREALKIFNAVSAFKAAGPIKIVLEELVDSTVCDLFPSNFLNSENL